MVPWPGTELWASTLGKWGLGHWSTGEVPFLACPHCAAPLRLPSQDSPPFFRSDSPPPPFRPLCSFSSISILCCCSSCTFTSSCVCRCCCPPEKLTVTWALFLNWSDFLPHSSMRALGWFKSVIVAETNPPPPFYSLWKIAQQCLKTFKMSTVIRDSFFLAFFSLAVYTPVLHTIKHNVVFFAFLSSLSQQHLCSVPLFSFHEIKDQHV